MDIVKKIAVYGSLRVGHYNFEHFNEYYPNEIIPLGTSRISGFKMYDLGAYPGVIVNNDYINSNTIVEFDILEVSDDVFEAIDRMELGANYSRYNLVIEDHLCTIYVYDGHVSENALVKSGNWNEYCNVCVD